jgi:hypothetical protein
MSSMAWSSGTLILRAASSDARLDVGMLPAIGARCLYSGSAGVGLEVDQQLIWFFS